MSRKETKIITGYFCQLRNFYLICSVLIPVVMYNIQSIKDLIRINT